MVKNLITIFLVFSLNYPLFCQKIDYSNIALNILKFQCMSHYLNRYDADFDKMKFQNAIRNSLFMQQYIYNLTSDDLINIKHSFSSKFKIFALLYPTVESFYIIVAVDNDGLFYYLSGFNKENFNTLFKNRKIKFQTTKTFTRSLLDLYVKTVVQKYNLIEEIQKKSLNINISQEIINVKFTTKSQKTNQIFKYEIRISKDGINLLSRKNK